MDTSDDMTDVAEQLKTNLSALRPDSSMSKASQDYVYSMGYHWLQAGEFEKARSAFETLWRACPGEAKYAGGLAHSALGQGHPDVAATYFLLALAMDETNAGYMLGLGRSFRACQLPGHARLAMQISEALGEQHDPKTAELARACMAFMGDA